MTWWTANKTTAWQKEKVFFVCKIPQMGKQEMHCLDNIASACKLQCISLHALMSSAHAVTCAHHIRGFIFNCRFIRCMIFWEITPELIVFDASLRYVCLDSSGWRSRLHLFICLLYPCLLQRLWHYTLSRVQERILHSLCVFAESCVHAYHLFNTIQPVDTKPTWFCSGTGLQDCSGLAP